MPRHKEAALLLQGYYNAGGGQGGAGQVVVD